MERETKRAFAAAASALALAHVHAYAHHHTTHAPDPLIKICLFLDFKWKESIASGSRPKALSPKAQNTTHLGAWGACTSNPCAKRLDCALCMRNMHVDPRSVGALICNLVRRNCRNCCNCRCTRLKWRHVNVAQRIRNDNNAAREQRRRSK